MEPVRKRMRLAGWDYSSEGTYFLTLCASNRKCMFSHIVGRGILDAPQVKLSKYGEYIQDALLYLQNRDPDIIFHKWVIMPNHVHILLSICNSLQVDDGASGKPRPTGARIPKLVSSLKRYTNRMAECDLWQSSYYDHIIRDEGDYLTRWQYIENNPAAWQDDDYYSE